ncbi:MAG: hypothetical protein ABIP93_17055 [Gemmatimonadaceae bacterium]
MSIGASVVFPNPPASPQGVTSPAGSVRGEGSARFELVVLGLFATFVTVLSALHEPWNGETQSWRLAIDSNGIVELFRNARYEGHPLLFHALLQLVGHLSRSWWAAAALHVVIACAAVFVILRYAPFSRLEKVLVVAGYFPAYEYSVLVREYGLGMLLAFAACAAWTAPRRRPALAILFLILLANTSVLGFLIALTAAGTFACEWLSVEVRDGRLRGRTMAIAAGCLLLAAVTVWIVVRQILPPSDAAWKGDGSVGGGASLWKIGWGLTIPLRALVPLAKVGEGTVHWNRWLLEPTTRIWLLADMAASLALIAAGCLIVVRRWSGLLFLLVSIVGLSLFFVLFVEGSARHYGHLVLAWIMAVWLSRSGPATSWPDALKPVLDRATRWAPRLLAISLIPMVLATAEFATADAEGTFYDAKHVADVLRERGLSQVPIIGIARSDAQAVGALLDRPVVFPDGTRGTFVVWGNAETANPPLAQIQATLDTELARACQVVVIGVAEHSFPEELLPTLRLIYQTPRRSMSRDHFRVFVKSAPASARCPAGPA